MQNYTETSQRNLFNLVLSFSRSLHDAGVPVNSSNLIDLFRCFDYINIREKQDFYAAARATLISSHNDLACFHRVFNEFWEQKIPVFRKNIEADNGNHQLKGQKQAGQQIFDVQDAGEKELGKKNTQLAYSPDEYLMKKDLGTMSVEELEQARKLMHELISIIANYKSHRRIIGRKGTELNFRKMLRKNAFYGQDGMEIIYRKEKIKKSRLMFLCDVSGSMQRYSNFLIQFIYALNQETSNLEVAVFSTRMTVITDFLKTRNVEESLRQVSEAVHDWAGGTNIGRCIYEFNDRFARKMFQSRTVVIILSDGWDRGDAYLMREEMEHLRRRTHKILWLNPLLGNSNYQPLCKGIRTALPYIDYFLPAHNLESFGKLIRQLRTVW